MVDLVDYKNDEFPCAFCQAVVASREGGATRELNPWAVHDEMLREREKQRQTAATASTSVGGVLVDNLDANLHCMVDGLLRNGSFSYCPAGGRRRPMDPFVRTKAENEETSKSSTADHDMDHYWSELDFARQANDDIRPDETRPDWEWRRKSTTAPTQEEERPIKSFESSNGALLHSRLRAQQERFDRAFSTKDARFPQGYAVYEDDNEKTPEFAREWAVMRDDDCVPAAWDEVEGQEDAEMRENRLSSQNDSSELHVDDVQYQATPLPRNKPDAAQAGSTTGQQEIKRISPSEDEDEEANFYDDQNQFPFAAPRSTTPTKICFHPPPIFVLFEPPFGRGLQAHRTNRGKTTAAMK